MILANTHFDHPNYDPKNKKIIGKMKDEIKGMVLEEFVGLRPKCYSLIYRGVVKDNTIQDGNIHHSSTSKGVKNKSNWHIFDMSIIKSLYLI